MKKYLSILLVLTMLLLAACGSSSYDKSAVNEGLTMETAPAGDFVSSGAASNGSATSMPEGRKWILTVHMDLETEELDTMLAYVTERVAEFGGYLEDQSIYNGSGYSSYRSRNADLTVRVPVEKADEFVGKVGEKANVTATSRNMEDVTLRYTATESRVKALQTEEERLLTLMEQAEDLSDLLEIESRLTEVRYELEMYTTNLRTLSNQIDYATVYMNIEEVRRYTPVEEPTFWERIRTGFADNLEALTEAAEDFAVWFLSSLPTIAVLLVLGGLLYLILSAVTKRSKARARKWDAERGSGEAQVPAPPKKEDEK